MRTLALAAAATALLAALPLAAAPVVPAGIGVKERGDGWTFVNDKSLALYTYDRDLRTPGESACDADCAKAWPPLTAPADAKPVGDWSIIARKDGAKQWAFKGRPLYGYAEEGGPSTAYGDGSGETWYVAYDPLPTPQEFSITNTLLGRTLADARGMTVYSFDSDKADTSACTDKCLNDWAPIEAPIAANGRAPWSTLIRPDGTKQWAYKGKPLYRYLHESAAFEFAGNDVGKTWHAVVLEPAAAYPAWVTIQGSDAGQLLADRKGNTIYTKAAGGARRGFGAGAMCGDEPCIDPEWKPVLADAEAKPEGNWSVMTNKDGTRQWAYRGAKLFTNTRDARPGDFLGIRFGGDRSWAAIMRSGLPMQGVSVGGDYSRSPQ